MTIAARYEEGIFRPLQIVDMEEGAVVEVVIPSGPRAAVDKRSIRDLPFYGLWKDRGEIGDGVGYVDSRRNNRRR